MKRSINANAQVNVLLRFFNNHAFFMKPKLFYTIFGYPRKKRLLRVKSPAGRRFKSLPARFGSGIGYLRFLKTLLLPKSQTNSKADSMSWQVSYSEWAIQRPNLDP
jgi:hypothetical protein